MALAVPRTEATESEEEASLHSLVETTDLTKEYGPVRALAGLDLDAWPREIHGLLGPNGAGKTTTLRIPSAREAHERKGHRRGSRPSSGAHRSEEADWVRGRECNTLRVSYSARILRVRRLNHGG
jgi:ATPase subunit of ABC transporter with duplicated ATPase domains